MITRIEPCSNPADIGERAVAVLGKDQVLDRAIGGCARRPADDNKFLTPRAFDLEPRMRTHSSVRRVGAL